MGEVAGMAWHCHVCPSLGFSMPWLGWEGTRGQCRGRLNSKLGQTLFKIVNLIFFYSSPPPVRHNGRKKEIFKILDEIWWSWFGSQMAHNGGGGVKNWSGFVKIQKVDDLVADLMSLLCLMRIRIWEGFWKVGLHHLVHLDVVLDEVQRVGFAWFEILLIQRLKVGIRLKMAVLTISACEHNLISNLIWFEFLWFQTCF